MKVQQNLQYLLLKTGSTPTALSFATKIPQPTIHRILKGESKDPRTSTLDALASHFHVSASDLRDVDLRERDLIDGESVLSGIKDSELPPEIYGMLDSLSAAQLLLVSTKAQQLSLQSKAKNIAMAQMRRLVEESGFTLAQVAMQIFNTQTLHSDR